MSAHPDNLERAEALCFAEFLKYRFARFMNGEGYFTSRTREKAPDPKLVIAPPRELTEEDFNPSRKEEENGKKEENGNGDEEKRNEKQSITVESVDGDTFSFNGEDLAEEYATWKEANAITLHKFLKEKLGDLPHKRAVIVHGCEATPEAAKKAAAYLSYLKNNYDYFTGPVGQPLLSDPVSGLVEDKNYGNPEVDTMMKLYEQHREESNINFARLREEQLAELRRNNPNLFGEFHTRSTLDGPHSMRYNN